MTLTLNYRRRRFVVQTAWPSSMNREVSMRVVVDSVIFAVWLAF